jgi:hypothetical protein
MHALMTELIPLATDIQAKGGFIKGIFKFLLVGIVILVLLGVFVGMKVSKRRR